MVAVALGRLGRAFGAGLDVVDIVDLIHEQVLRLDDDGDRLERGHIFEAHRHRAGNLFAYDHVDLGLAREQPQHLADIVALKLTHADPAVLGQIVRLDRGGRSCRRSRRRSAGRRCRGGLRRRCCGRTRRRCRSLREKDWRTIARLRACRCRCRLGRSRWTACRRWRG